MTAAAEVPVQKVEAVEKSPRAGRIEWIDVARGVGMVLVILGHTVPKTTPHMDAMGKWIYSFHMPLFFFISGLLIREDAPVLSWGKTFSKAFRGLMVPYFLFALISYIAWYKVLRFTGKDDSNVSTLVPLWGIFYGTFESGLKYISAPVWFFSCLFCVQLLHRALPRRLGDQSLPVMLIFFTGLSYIYFSPFPLQWQRLPWNLDLACLALLFVHLGQRMHPWLSSLTSNARVRCLWAIPVLLAIQTWCGVANSRVDFVRGHLGNPALFVYGSICGILMTVFLVPVLPRFLNYIFGTLIGRNTLIIFPLHMFCFSVVRYAEMKSELFGDFLYATRWGTVTIYTVFTLLAFLVITPITKLVFPWLLPTAKKSPRVAA